MTGLTMPADTVATSGVDVPVAVPVCIPVTTMNTTPVAPPVAGKGGKWDGTVLLCCCTFRNGGGRP